MEKSNLIGVWKLVKYVISWENSGKMTHPYGENPIGYLIYTPDDYVSVHIMRENRLNYPSDECNDRTFHKKIEMADNYGGYVGRYEIRNNTVIHYPEVSGFIHFLQIPQIREFQLLNDKLILECPYVDQENGNKGLSQLIWERLPTVGSVHEK